MSNKRTVIFDLDGTLIDSAPDITLALNKALIKNRLDPVDESTVRTYIGNGSKELITDILKRKELKIDQATFSSIHKVFVDAYRNNFFFYSTLYPYVSTALAKLTLTFNLVCLTNKPSTITNFILGNKNLAKHFRLTIATDIFSKRKPSPHGVLFSAQKFDCRLQDILLIGDSVVDMQTARNAGVRSIGVEYGYANRANLIKEGALTTITCFREIPRILKDIF